MKIKVAKIRIERVSLSRNRPDIITEFHTVDYFKNNYFGYDKDSVVFFTQNMQIVDFLTENNLIYNKTEIYRLFYSDSA